MTDPQTQIKWVSIELDKFLIILEAEQQQLNQNEQMLKEHRTTNNFGPLNQDWAPPLQASEKEYEFEQVSWKHKQKIFEIRWQIFLCYKKIQHWENELFEGDYGRSNRIIRIRNDHKKMAESERLHEEKRQNGKIVKRTSVQFNPYCV